MIPHVKLSVDGNQFPSVIERYYEQRYIIDVEGKANEDQYVYTHTNGLFVIGLAPKHKIFNEDVDVESINFDIGEKDLTKNSVRGTKKKGGIRMKKNTIIAKITCRDGTEYFAYSCVYGTLLEINTELIENPSLLKRFPSTQGYLAIIQPHKEKSLTNDLSGFLSAEEYESKRS